MSYYFVQRSLQDSHSMTGQCYIFLFVVAKYLIAQGVYSTMHVTEAGQVFMMGGAVG